MLAACESILHASAVYVAGYPTATVRLLSRLCLYHPTALQNANSGKNAVVAGLASMPAGGAALVAAEQPLQGTQLQPQRRRLQAAGSGGGAGQQLGQQQPISSRSLMLLMHAEFMEEQQRQQRRSLQQQQQQQPTETGRGGSPPAGPQAPPLAPQSAAPPPPKLAQPPRPPQPPPPAPPPAEVILNLTQLGSVDTGGGAIWVVTTSGLDANASVSGEPGRARLVDAPTS